MSFTDFKIFYIFIKHENKSISNKAVSCIPLNNFFSMNVRFDPPYGLLNWFNVPSFWWIKKEIEYKCFRFHYIGFCFKCMPLMMNFNTFYIYTCIKVSNLHYENQKPADVVIIVQMKITREKGPIIVGKVYNSLFICNILQFRKAWQKSPRQVRSIDIVTCFCIITFSGDWYRTGIPWRFAHFRTANALQKFPCIWQSLKR